LQFDISAEYKLTAICTMGECRADRIWTGGSYRRVHTHTHTHKGNMILRFNTAIGLDSEQIPSSKSTHISLLRPYHSFSAKWRFATFCNMSQISPTCQEICTSNSGRKKTATISLQKDHTSQYLQSVSSKTNPVLMGASPTVLHTQIKTNHICRIIYHVVSLS
jgi:hypothetical protein